MTRDTQASTVVTAFRAVPGFAHGLVRDLRVRWALADQASDLGPPLNPG